VSTGGGGGSGAGGSGKGGSSAAGGSGGGGAGGGTAGAGGSAAGAGGAGGSSAPDAGSGGAGGRGGSGGSGPADGGGAGGSDGGTAACAGHAVSLSANGTAMDSDAAQQRVVINLGSDLPIGNANRTIEFWAYIKTTDWVGEKNEIYYYGGNGTDASLGLDFGTNPVMGMTGNHATLNPFDSGAFTVDSTAYLGITSTMDQWVHIAMTWDGTALRTYVNGTVRITTNATGGAMLATMNSALTVGCNPSNMGCFNGLFDEVRVWNVARSAQQIMASYNRPLIGNEMGLVGYYKFDEANGATTIADSVTATGHTAHPAMLMAATGSPTPMLVTPPMALPFVCP
jgi:hypothetical protein